MDSISIDFKASIQDLIGFCKGKKWIVCYGAGEDGALMGAFFYMNNIKISAFIVSDAEKNKNARTYLGIPVYTISEMPFAKEQCGIVLTLDDIYHNDVMYSLKQSGISLVYRNTNKIINYLEKFFQVSGIGLLLRLSSYGGYMQEYGWLESCKTGLSIDSRNKGLPWITYSAMEFLQKRIKKDMHVLEYGCGGSTFWWAERVTEIISIEHDKKWYEKIKKGILPNVKLVWLNLVYGGDYSAYVLKYRQYFDIVVIDGRDRVNCLRNSLNALKDDGIVLFDNTDREEYKEAYDLLSQKGFRELEFVGLAPCVSFKSKTSIYYRQNNCFEI